MADMMYGSATAGGDLSEDTNADFYNNTNVRPRNPGLYIGNLTWWTTDQDVINNIIGIGVNDVQEVKFFENRNNGQSKGFCVVTFGSETSLPIVMEKLPKIELHGQNPVVTPYNRQNLNLFESQTKTRPQINNSSNATNNGPTAPQHAAGIMGISSISGVHANTQGLPYPAGGLNNYNSQGLGGMGGPVGMSATGIGGMGVPRGSYHSNMRMSMRGPRPGGFVPRIGMSNPMNNGPMIPGGAQMNRMPRYMQPQNWSNSQSGYNSGAPRMPQVSMDMPSRIGKPDDLGVGGVSQEVMGSQHNYYSSNHPNSQADSHYRDIRDHRDLRSDDRDSGSRRIDDRILRDDRSLRHSDDRPSLRNDDRSHKMDDRSSSRRDERSRRDEESSSRRDDSKREERSSRREKDRDREKEPSRKEKNHRSDDRARSRSRDRGSRDRSRDRRERRDRRDRY